MFQSTRPRGARRQRQVKEDYFQRVSIHAPAWGATSRGVSARRILWMFQSTRPRGARPSRTCHAPSIPPFQSTRPRGARLARHTPGVGHLIVSIHAPAWGATKSRPAAGGKRCVSIHAPAWGATRRRVWTLRLMLEFQSTRPRGARLHRCILTFNIPKVSIHAPAWGATQTVWPSGDKILVSIHAPAWGATSANLDFARQQFVSIHAPAWGATLSQRIRQGVKKVFQSTRPRGARRRCTSTMDSGRLFQSTRPRGARPILEDRRIQVLSFNPRARVGRDYKANSDSSLAGGFNPRARVGRDCLLTASKIFGTLFQSTRPRGARPDELTGDTRYACVSIHAPAWGATQLACYCHGRHRRFNPRARVGRDPRKHQIIFASPGFNPRARVGRDRHLGILRVIQRDVSIHAPAWGATMAAARKAGAPGGVSIHAPAWGATATLAT